MRLVLAAAAAAVAVAAPGDVVVPVPRGAPVSAVLLAAQVVWARDDALPSLYVGTRRVWTAPRTPLPADYPTSPGFDYFVLQSVQPLAHTGRKLVFVRWVGVLRKDVCRRSRPSCGPPDDMFPLYREVWRGPASGPFRRIAGGPDAPAVTATAGSGESVVLAERPDDAHARLVLVRKARRTVLVTRPGRPVVDLELAGRYAAWLERTSEDGRSFRLVVFDVNARRIRYTLDGQALRTRLLQFDVQSDGTLAFATYGGDRNDCNGCVGWASVREPRPHFLRVHGTGGVRIARGRIAFTTSRAGAPGSSAFATTDLRGRLRTFTDAGLSSGPFDFDGTRLAYVDERRGATVIRVVPVPSKRG